MPRCSGLSVHWQGADGHVDVWSNFAAYGLQPPVGLLRADSHRPAFRPGLQEILDAIVCDPPYGVSNLLAASCYHCA